MASPPVYKRWRWQRWLALALTVAIAFGQAGCTPRRYRQRADAESYGILAAKSQVPAWQTPPYSVEPPPASRNHDPFDPDKSPLPPDDPAAHEYMHRVDGKHGYRHWHKQGDAASIEDPTWVHCLDLSDSGSLRLERNRAVELGLLNSREYQFELENLYLSVLRLTLDRFEFQTRWFGLNRTDYEHFGNSSTPGESNTLATRTNLGFVRSFASGSELLVDFANAFVWEFTGDNSGIAPSNINMVMIQPLLRAAFRDIRLETLTQSERSVLYNVRDFARFRKQFYFDIVSGDSGYLSLLLQLQALRNLEANLQSLEQNLRAHQALSEAGIVSPLQVDQVTQSYQTGRLALIRARNRLQTSLDSYKVRLGLPPEMNVDLDDSLLKQFELNSPELIERERVLDELMVLFRDREQPPSREQILGGFRDLQAMHEDLVEQLGGVRNELQHWTERQKQQDPANDDQAKELESEAQEKLAERLKELAKDLAETGREIQEAAQSATEQPIEDAWQSFQAHARQESAHLSDLVIIQTQIRVNLIELDPLDVDQQEAVALGLANRLDLMNQRGEVVDAWRRVHVARNGLRAGLDVVLDADVATDPAGNNPVKFSSEFSRYRVGLALDGPLNRKSERNVYRAAQIEYQRARREFIADRDGIVQAIRRDLRNLEADRLNFEIARQQLVVAARQVELARIQLLAPGQAGDSSTTQDVLRALNDLLDSKNGLIAIWVNYETDRLQLQLDTEALQLDDTGLPLNDDLSGTSGTAGPELIPTPPEPPAIPAD